LKNINWWRFKNSSIEEIKLAFKGKALEQARNQYDYCKACLKIPYCCRINFKLPLWEGVKNRVGVWMLCFLTRAALGLSAICG